MGLTEKKINFNDATIQIRILKALEDVKPFGIFKHFYMVKIIRNLKQPNIIEAKHIWLYLSENYNLNKFDEIENEPFENSRTYFDDIFED